MFQNTIFCFLGGVLSSPLRRTIAGTLPTQSVSSPIVVSGAAAQSLLMESDAETQEAVEGLPMQVDGAGDEEMEPHELDHTYTHVGALSEHMQVDGPLDPESAEDNSQQDQEPNEDEVPMQAGQEPLAQPLDQDEAPAEDMAAAPMSEEPAGVDDEASEEGIDLPGVKDPSVTAAISAEDSTSISSAALNLPVKEENDNAPG